MLLLSGAGLVLVALVRAAFDCCRQGATLLTPHPLQHIGGCHLCGVDPQVVGAHRWWCGLKPLRWRRRRG